MVWQQGERQMLKDFREFALKGNVVDLAVGVIIGAAFGKIVESLVGDMFMPVLGSISGGLDFSNYFTPLSAKVTAASLEEARRADSAGAHHDDQTSDSFADRQRRGAGPGRGSRGPFIPAGSAGTRVRGL